ncbi:MAG: AraC family transcriptional regulator, partial [Chloroflexota bacterium]
MVFFFEGRPSDSPLVEGIWRTRSEGGGSFTSSAASNFEMVVTKQKGITTLTLRGPETMASPAPIPEDAEFFGITFKLGTFMPHMSASSLVNGSTNLPEITNQSFWLMGAAWQFPTFDNADTFVRRLVRERLLVRDEVVGAILQEQPQPQPPAWSERTL